MLVTLILGPGPRADSMEINFTGSVGALKRS